MTNAEKQAFREAVYKKLAELAVLLGSDTNDGSAIELDQTRVGRLARMEAMQHHAIAQVQHERAKDQRLALQRLLSRIEDDDFGECYYCGEEIGVGRMLIRPESMKCIVCAEAED